MQWALCKAQRMRSQFGGCITSMLQLIAGNTMPTRHCCSDRCQCSPNRHRPRLTSRAFTGEKITSSGSPAARAASSTGEGCGLLRLPRPFGLPGWVTTPATCAAARSKVVLCLVRLASAGSDALTWALLGMLCTTHPQSELPAGYMPAGDNTTDTAALHWCRM